MRLISIRICFGQPKMNLSYLEPVALEEQEVVRIRRIKKKVENGRRRPMLSLATEK